MARVRGTGAASAAPPGEPESGKGVPHRLTLKPRVYPQSASYPQSHPASLRQRQQHPFSDHHPSKGSQAPVIAPETLGRDSITESQSPTVHSVLEAQRFSKMQMQTGCGNLIHSALGKPSQDAELEASLG